MLNKISIAHDIIVSKNTLTLKDIDNKTIGIITGIKPLDKMSDNEYFRFMCSLKTDKQLIRKYKNKCFIANNQVYILVNKSKVAAYPDIYQDFINDFKRLTDTIIAYYN